VDLDRAVKWLRMHPNPDPNGDPMGGMLMATPLAWYDTWLAVCMCDGTQGVFATITSPPSL
ncbi:MAG: hypothetical protein ACKO8Z_00180, partial [Prosthecobacter sp.]